ncbi:MAG: tetratricopeptide repeat protein [Candidatus Saccharimonadales bacterium]
MNAELDEVVVLLRQQLQSEPESIHLHHTLAKVLDRRGKAAESIATYRDAIAMHPQSLELHEGLADLLERQGKTAEANTELDQVLVLLREQVQSKADMAIHRKLGMVYLRRCERQEAIAQFRQAIELDPNQSGACNAIGWDLATTLNPKRRDGAIAVEFATKACELTEWKIPTFLDTLAAACAECGDFEAAVKWQTKAIELEFDEKNKEDYGTRLKLYQVKVPYHSFGRPD